MEYQQPFGGLADASYVNGNPSTGTQGSIPPAAAIEDPQREIVEVINEANVRGYNDFNNDACAAPSDGDLEQLRKAIEGFIRGAPLLAGVNGSQSYSTHGSYSWTVPAGIHWVLCKVWAAGGGGGGASNANSAASGAGGGEYREGWLHVVPGESVAIIVGEAGAGGSSSGTNGAAGGNSSATGSLASISCVGGGYSPGAVGVIDNNPGSGGTGGSGGSFVVPGTQGGYTVDLTARTINGMGGGSFGCGWGLFGFATNGLFPGQGGSGASGGAMAGGHGADGRIALQW